METPMSLFTTDDSRWHAVLDRDSTVARDFVYAVETTGIYCIPGCPSRKPRRENVRFFDTASEAEKSGYRPCKRCRPDDILHLGIDSERIVTACRTIESADQSVPLVDLAKQAGLSSSHFRRLFIDRVGVSPKVYAQTIRDNDVRRQLELGHSVTRAIFDAGYGSASRFYERANFTLGMPPKEYKRGGKGLTIRYAFGKSFLGPVIAAFTEDGVCAIEFGATRKSMVGALRNRFPKAIVSDGSEELEKLVTEVTAYIKTPDKGLDLPLDIQGTAFQQRVWQELQTIPVGETRTYGDIAQALGKPKSVRAVAAACASNNLAVAIPCHRVVRKSGQLAGYFWGLDRKQALIENERTDTPECPDINRK